MLTSTPASLHSFAASGPTVLKSLSHPSIRTSEHPSQALQLYTTLLGSSDLDRSDELSHSVGFFQQFVKKKRDIRVTIVGKQSFAIAIESQRSPLTAIDWRRYDLPRTPHSIITLDTAIHAKCVKFLDHFGLSYGAFDFAEDDAGEFWFLELNPNGLWAWLELLTGSPISGAVAEYLSALASPKGEVGSP